MWPKTILSRLTHHDSCTYLPLSATQLVLTYHKVAIAHTALVDLTDGSWHELDLPITDTSYDAMCKVSETELIVRGSNATTPTAMFNVKIDNGKARTDVLRRSTDLPVAAEYISVPRPVSGPRIYGATKSGEVYGLLHEPANPNFVAPEGTLPPLIVFAHGGPTGHVAPKLDLDMQYWNSRGYAILLLNYAGSTGYGKEYRVLLDGKWGAIDSEDAASLATHLAKEGVVDESKIGVYGPSAGGYIAEKTICDVPSVWAASISLFGIAEMKDFNSTTHKFESRYADNLLYGYGVQPSQEERDAIDKERSPLTYTDKITAPLLLLHGDQDKVVPPAQSEAMRDALAAVGKPVELIMFEGEAHARWQGDALRRSVMAQERWWRKYLLKLT